MKAKKKDNISKKYLILVVALSIILGTGIVVAEDKTNDIRISPATLNLNMIEDKCVTVHAEIDYDSVNKDLETLTLEGDGGSVYADSTKSDNRGNLVVKFKREDVAGIVVVGEKVTLMLTGKMNDEDETPFTGLDTIRVIE